MRSQNQNFRAHERMTFNYGFRVGSVYIAFLFPDNITVVWFKKTALWVNSGMLSHVEFRLEKIVFSSNNSHTPSNTELGDTSHHVLGVLIGFVQSAWRVRMSQIMNDFILSPQQGTMHANPNRLQRMFRTVDTFKFVCIRHTTAQSRRLHRFVITEFDV